MQRVLTRAAVGAMLILSTTAISACSDDDEDPVSPQQVTTEVVNSIQTDAHIMGALHESNLGEIEAAQAAVQRATDTEVKAFAGMMVTDHTTLDAQGTALATQVGVAPALPTTTLSDQQDREMTQLSLVTGTTFDRNYIAQQVSAHTRTLAIVDAAITKAQQAALKTLLQSTVRPKVAAHLAMAQGIAARIGNP
jgi:putative membrane protein